MSAGCGWRRAIYARFSRKQHELKERLLDIPYPYPEGSFEWKIDEMERIGFALHMPDDGVPYFTRDDTTIGMLEVETREWAGVVALIYIREGQHPNG